MCGRGKSIREGGGKEDHLFKVNWKVKEFVKLTFSVNFAHRFYAKLIMHRFLHRPEGSYSDLKASIYSNTVGIRW